MHLFGKILRKISEFRVFSAMLAPRFGRLFTRVRLFGRIKTSFRQTRRFLRALFQIANQLVSANEHVFFLNGMSSLDSCIQFKDTSTGLRSTYCFVVQTWWRQEIPLSMEFTAFWKKNTKV